LETIPFARFHNRYTSWGVFCQRKKKIPSPTEKRNKMLCFLKWKMRKEMIFFPVTLLIKSLGQGECWEKVTRPESPRHLRKMNCKLHSEWMEYRPQQKAGRAQREVAEESNFPIYLLRKIRCIYGKMVLLNR
jgi:hypothetical protein